MSKDARHTCVALLRERCILYKGIEKCSSYKCHRRKTHVIQENHSEGAVRDSLLDMCGVCGSLLDTCEVRDPVSKDARHTRKSL